jgi:hypothetical protein
MRLPQSARVPMASLRSSADRDDPIPRLVRRFATRGKHRKDGPAEIGSLDPLEAAYEVATADEGTYGAGEVTAACEMIAELSLTVGERPEAQHNTWSWF